MSIDRADVEAAIYNVAVSAFTYYPDKPLREPGYTIDEDLDWCLLPLRHTPAEDRARWREQIRELITNPLADRRAFITELDSLAI